MGRIGEAGLTDALRDEHELKRARTCLAETAGHGSTPEERDAADAWLRDAQRDGQQGEPARHRTLQPSRAAAKGANGTANPPKPARRDTGGPVTRKAGDTLVTGSKRVPVKTPHVSPKRAGTAHQVDALTRQQQRILHRCALIDYVLAAEHQGGQTLTMGDALGELLEDITEAARTIGTILQHVRKGARRRHHPLSSRRLEQFKHAL